MRLDITFKLSLALSCAALITLVGCTAQGTSKSGAQDPKPAVAKEPQPVKQYSKELSLQGVSFRVDSPNGEGENTVTITPTGLEHGEPYTAKIDGQIVAVKVDDLDASGSPEVYVIAQGSAPEHKGSVVACAANGKSSMTPVNIEADTPEIRKGYAGHDEYEAMEGTFSRRFKLYDGDKESGKTRQVQYKLKKGEAAWQLKIDKVIEY